MRALDARSAAERLPLFEQPGNHLAENEPPTRLPVMPPGQHVIHDYRSLGLSLKGHPLCFLRQRLERSGVTPSGKLPSVRDGRRVTVAAWFSSGSARQGKCDLPHPEDEEGVANIIVWQRSFERFRPVVMGSKLISATGRLQSESGVIHIVAERMEDLTPWLDDLLERRREKGRDEDEMRTRQAGSVMPRGRNFQ